MNILYQKEIPLRYNVDIFIAGGGPAGVAAAVTAARQGAKVFLAESLGMFGGTGTAGLVPAFMNFGNGVDFLAGGFGYELVKTLYPDDEKPMTGKSIEVEKLKKYYDDVCREAGVNFTFFTTLVDVKSSGGNVEYVVLNGKSGTFAVKAKVYIDCTGDADLCTWAGADYNFGNEEGVCMPATLCSLWQGIDWEKEKQSRKEGSVSKMDQLEKAIADGVFTLEDRHLPGIWNIFDRMGGGNIGHMFNVDATDEKSLTEAMIRGREYMPEYEKFYKEYMIGYENMYLVQTGSIAGIRESRRVVGDYILNVEDFINRADFDDEIGRYSYPVDIHIMKPTKDAYNAFNTEHTNMRYKDGESYGIPYRALIPSKLGNVLVGGRCISTDRQMQSSVRVMPGCYITGQACGMAAYLALKNGGSVRNINVAELQSKLKSIGAYLPRS